MIRTRNRSQDWLIQHDAIVFPVAAALTVRVVLSVVGAVIVQTTPIQPHFEFYSAGVTPLPPTGIDLWVAPFQRWDAVWYELIAGRGYLATDSTPVFFPLFPLLMRVLALGSDAVLLGGMLAATFCITLTYILFYRVTQQLFNKRTALLGLIAWAAFPTTFYLFIPYAESLFVLCAIACLEAARQKKWLAAGVIGGLGALTRSPGIWLAAPLGIEWLSQMRAFDWKTRVQTFLPLLLVPLGLGLYMLYLQVRFGDALLWVHALSLWQNTFSLPWDTIILTAREILFGDPSAFLNNLLDFFSTLFVLTMVMLGLLPQDWRTISLRGWTPRLPWMYGIYGLIFTLFPLTLISHTGNVGIVPMASAARRAVIIFPAFMTAGSVLQGRLRLPLYIALAFGLQLIFVYIFVRWLWVD